MGDGPALDAVAREWAQGFPAGAGGVRLARIRVREAVTVWRWRGDVDAAVSAASELLVNAGIYGCKRGHQAWLRLELLADDTLVVDVSDPVDHFPSFARHLRAGSGGLAKVGVLGEVSWFLRPYCGKTVRVRIHPPTRP
jgi:hypothetical protein